MRPNKIKQLWSEGKPVTLGWLSLNNPFSAEVMARMGFANRHFTRRARGVE